MFSIWEQQSFLQADDIIIGSGIVGLTTAYYRKQLFPERRVMILERGILPAGASTKNAGFACMGSPTELFDDLQTQPMSAVVDLFLLRKKGLDRLCALLGKEKMDYRQEGSYELLMESDLDVIAQLESLNTMLGDALGEPAFALRNERLSGFGFNAQKVKALIENRLEGSIDTGKTMQALIERVVQSGVMIRTGCHVTRIEEEKDQVQVFTRDPLRNEMIPFRCRQLFICNNAFVSALLPELDVQPGRGQVLITEPIAELPFRGIFHFDRGYYYFRTYQDRILFGGGRNLDKNTEATTSFDLNEAIQQDLEDKLKTLILPGRSVTIASRWTGIMAFGQTKRPIVQQYAPRIWLGVRMGGMGVAIGSEVGWTLNQLAAES